MASNANSQGDVGQVDSKQTKSWHSAFSPQTSAMNDQLLYL